MVDLSKIVEDGKVLMPMMFSNETATPSSAKHTENIQCLKCDKEWCFPKGKDDLLGHLFLEHRLVIADVEDVALLDEYLRWWRKVFTGFELEEYCTTLLLDQMPDGTFAKNERYYLLSDILPEDFELRRKLQKECLEKVLAQHQFERTDRSFSKECLYCRDIISGLRSEYLEHLFTKHFLQLGKPENLVYVDELIAKVQSNLENLICLYCEKVFKDRVTLKEHMRKKGHKRINPNNCAYDKYFLINYENEKSPSERGGGTAKRRTFQNYNRSQQHKRNYRDVQLNNEPITTTLRSNRDSTADFEECFAVNKGEDDSDSDWSDWDGEGTANLNCLFCMQQEASLDALKEHLLATHKFDFNEAIKGHSFYQKIKMVNYVRRQIRLLRRCVVCDQRCETDEALLEHLTNESHFSLGVKSRWDKPEYFFPTYEDDGLLCVLDDSPNDDLDDTVVRIISEETTAQINKDAERLSLENFKFNEMGI